MHGSVDRYLLAPGPCPTLIFVLRISAFSLCCGVLVHFILSYELTIPYYAIFIIYF